MFNPWNHTAAAKSLQSWPTLCDPIDGSLSGSPVPGILQARTLEWVAISFSSAWKWKWRWSHWVVSDYSHPHGLQPTRFLRPWDFPGKSTGVGCNCPLWNHTSYLKKTWLYSSKKVSEQHTACWSCSIYTSNFCWQTLKKMAWRIFPTKGNASLIWK